MYSYKPRNPNHRPWSTWQIFDKHARDVLLALEPYLITKKRQSELVIKFVDVCERQWQEMRKEQKAPYHVTRDMYVARKYYWEQVAELNATSTVRAGKMIGGEAIPVPDNPGLAAASIDERTLGDKIADPLKYAIGISLFSLYCLTANPDIAGAIVCGLSSA